MRQIQCCMKKVCERGKRRLEVCACVEHVGQRHDTVAVEVKVMECMHGCVFRSVCMHMLGICRCRCKKGMRWRRCDGDVEECMFGTRPDYGYAGVDVKKTTAEHVWVRVCSMLA